jgi:hypothetical protein
LEIKLVALLGIEDDAFGESLEAREADADFTFAWENAHEGVLAEIIGDSGDFFVGGEILERDFRVGPNSFLLIRANSKDSAGESCRFGGKGGSRDRKCQEKETQVGHSKMRERRRGALTIEHGNLAQGGAIQLIIGWVRFGGRWLKKMGLD